MNLNECVECGGSLKTLDGQDVWIDGEMVSDYYRCEQCGWDSELIGDPEELETVDEDYIDDGIDD